MTMMWVSKEIRESTEYMLEDYADYLTSEKVIEFLCNKENWKKVIRKEEDVLFNNIRANYPSDVSKWPLISPNDRAQFRYVYLQGLEEIAEEEILTKV